VLWGVCVWFVCGFVVLCVCVFGVCLYVFGVRGLFVCVSVWLCVCARVCHCVLSGATNNPLRHSEQVEEVRKKRVRKRMYCSCLFL